MSVVVVLLGLAVGSFLNVVIGRLRAGETGWRNRSRCPKCRTLLAGIDLVPLLSFALLRGRCRTCRKPISWRYPIIEASTAALFLAIYVLHGGVAGVFSGQWLFMVRDAIFVSGLTVVFVIDLLDMVVFDSVTLPMMAVACLFNLALGAKPLNLLGAALCGGGFFLIQYVVSRGRWIGGGDIRIGAMMGMMLGFPGVLPALFFSYVLGAFFALVLLASGRVAWSSRMAFGTFLSVGTLIVLFFGGRLIAWYASFLSL